MTDELFASLPDSARVWIHATDRQLASEEQMQALDALNAFLRGWASHGRSVEGRAAIVDNRFVVITAHVPDGDVSGCGIDASVHALSDIAHVVGFDWAPALDVFCAREDGVIQVDRMEFAELAARGTITPDTIVYDTSLTTLGEWRSNGFARPARNSWHGRVFRFQTEAV